MLISFCLIACVASFFTNDYVVEFSHDNPQRAEEYAVSHGLVFKGRVFANHFHFLHPKVHRRSAQSSSRKLDLDESDEVVWFEQQFVRKRVKRDFQIDEETVVQTMNDPLYDEMWYLIPDYENRNEKETRHMNITAAWNMGFTGKGVVLSMLDDGIEMTHPDLAENYDARASTDINGNDDDPTPRYNKANERLKLDDPNSYTTGSISPKITDNLKGYIKEINRHGTRCAGEVAASANNNVCVPGVAYHAKVGGVRMLDGDVTDLVEARSIGHNQDYVDIYSASWGPDDDGRTVDGPAKLAIKAFLDGANEGRDGKGNIFVWASGNGGRYNDNCNCDGYTNNIYTISISSTSERENIPWYSEPCASTLASTYSSGASDEKQIITTDLRGMCTKKHTGTSASAPLAAGIIALALQANPELTWRDVQHILVRTSEKHQLNTKDWKLNSMGRWFSNRYGYGLMNAGRIVETALTWRNFPAQKLCTVVPIAQPGQPGGTKSTSTQSPADTLTVEFKFECDERLTMLEHVTAVLSLTPIGRRGDLEVNMISPRGTKSNILGQRPHDIQSSGFNRYEFMSVEFWDEDPSGNWKIEFKNLNTKGVAVKSPVTLKEVEIRFRGSEGFSQDPEERENDQPEDPKEPDEEPPTEKPATTKLEETTKMTEINEVVEHEKPEEIKVSPPVPEEPKTTQKPTTTTSTAKETTEEKTTKTTTKEESTTEVTTIKESLIEDVPPPDRTIHRPLPKDDADNHSDIQSLLIMLIIGVPSLYLLFQLIVKYKKKDRIVYKKLPTISNKNQSDL